MDCLRFDHLRSGRHLAGLQILPHRDQQLSHKATIPTFRIRLFPWPNRRWYHGLSLLLVWKRNNPHARLIAADWAGRTCGTQPVVGHWTDGARKPKLLPDCLFEIRDGVFD